MRRASAPSALVGLAALSTLTACSMVKPVDAEQGPHLARSDQDLVLQQPAGGAWGKQIVAAWNTAHPDQKVTGAGDPGRQVVRSGHPAQHHRRHRAVPDLQHLPGIGAAVPDSRAGWSRSTSFPDGDAATSSSAPATTPSSTSRRTGTYYQLPWKSNPVMIFYNKKMFAKAGLDPTIRRWRATPTSSPPRRSWCPARGQVRDLPGAVQRVLPVLVRLLPAVCGRDRWHAAGREQEVDLRRRRRARPSRASGSSSTPEPGRQGDLQRRLLRRRDRGDGHRRAVGDRQLQGQGRLGRGTGTDLQRHDPSKSHVQRREERRDVRLLQEPG